MGQTVLTHKEIYPMAKGMLGLANTHAALIAGGREESNFMLLIDI